MNLSPTRAGGPSGGPSGGGPSGSAMLDDEGQGFRDAVRMDKRQRERMELLLQQAKRWWDEREDFRQRRARSRDYRRGRQWEETTKNDKGQTVTEKELIQEDGRIPWVMNQVASVARNLKGQFRQNQSERVAFAVDRENTEAVEMMNVKLRGTRRHNRAPSVEADQFEEHIMSGASAFKTQIEWVAALDRPEVTIDPVDQTRLFFNTDVEDRRLKDLRIIGELHDFSKEELLATFARDENGDFSYERANAIKRTYSNIDDMQVDPFAQSGPRRSDGLSFYTTHDTGLVRVIEVWKKRHILKTFVHDTEAGTWQQTQQDPRQLALLNQERRAEGRPELIIRTRMEPTWWCYYLSPHGDVLYETETPYEHQEHPYVLGMANLLDGETWGLLEMIIDPQRWLNRLVVMIDHAMGAGAKGVLLVPESAVPDGMNIDDFAETWSTSNGVIKYKPKPGVPRPEEIVTNSIKPGSFQLLQQLKQWIEETSGVTGAQQGLAPKSGTPAALFQQQVIQSGLTNLDFFESFFEALRTLDYKVVQLIQQAINQPLVLNEGATRSAVEYNPKQVRELKFDTSVAQVEDTATYRQLFEQDLQQFLAGGFIDFGTFLQISSHPKSEALLRLLQQRDPDVLDVGATEMQGAMSALQDTPGAQGAQGAASPDDLSGRAQQALDTLS